MSSRSSSGPSGESGSRRHLLAGEVALGEPAERAAIAVDEQGVGDLGARSQLRPHLGGRLADVGERRLPEVDVGDPHQRQALQRPVGADEVLDELVGGVHQQLGRGRVLGDLAALAHDRDPVAHLDRLVDVVGDEEDGLADLRLQAQELVLQALAVDRVDRAEGLVHQHHQRVRRQRPGDADPLLLAAGELRRVAIGEVGVEPDQGQQLGAAGAPRAPSSSRAAAARRRCSRRSCGGGRGRPAGSRSRSRAAAGRGCGRGPTARRSGCRPR